jgi:hypothetical protein
MSIITRTEIQQLEHAFAAKRAGVAQMSDRVLSLTAEPDAKKLYQAEKYAKQLLREIAALRRLEASLSGAKARKEITS